MAHRVSWKPRILVGRADAVRETKENNGLGVSYRCPSRAPGVKTGISPGRNGQLLGYSIPDPEKWRKRGIRHPRRRDDSWPEYLAVAKISRKFADEFAVENASVRCVYVRYTLYISYQSRYRYRLQEYHSCTTYFTGVTREFRIYNSLA